jgi:EAL domain-containing protein (putative c-di-GMP-specific phosphodiesterase class I)
MDMLEDWNSDYVQCYLFSPPMATEKVMEYIASNQTQKISIQLEELAIAAGQ